MGDANSDFAPIEAEPFRIGARSTASNQRCFISNRNNSSRAELLLWNVSRPALEFLMGKKKIELLSKDEALSEPRVYSGPGANK